MSLIINIIGIGRRSGKTGLVEFLTRELTKRKYRVWTVKHISTSFNTIRKDTWRHLEAGALSVVAATPNELVSIKRIHKPSLEIALEEISKEIGIVIVEGFKSSKYPKIIASRTVKDASELMKEVKEVFAISGPIAEKEGDKSIESIPILKPDELVTKVEKMIINYAIKGLPGLNCRSCGYDFCSDFAQAMLRREASIDQCLPLKEKGVILKVDGKRIYLSQFPATLIKNTVLSMVGSLKGLDKRRPKTFSLVVKVESNYKKKSE